MSLYDIDFNNGPEVVFSFGEINTENEGTVLYRLTTTDSLPNGVSISPLFSYRPSLTVSPGTWLDADVSLSLSLIRRDSVYSVEYIENPEPQELPYYEMRSIGETTVATQVFTIKAFPIVLGSSVYTPTYITGVVPLSLLSSRVRYTGVTREIQYFYDDVFLGETSSVWSSDITGFSPSVTATYLGSFARRGIIPRSIYMNANETNYWAELACDNETYYQFYYEQIDGNFRRGKRKPLALINDEQLFGDWQAPALTSVSGVGTSTLYFSSNLNNYSLVNLNKDSIESLFLQYSGFNTSILSVTAILGEVYLDNDVISLRATTENKVEMSVEVSDGMSTMQHVVTLEGFTGAAEYVSPVADRESSPDYDILWRVVSGSYFSNLLGSYTTTITLIAPYSDVDNTEWYVISGSLDGGVGASAYLTASDGSINGVIFLVEHIEKGAPIGSGIVIKSGNGDNVLMDSEQGATNFIDWFEAPANNTVSKTLDLKGVSRLYFHTSLVGSSPDFSAKELHSVSWDAATVTVTLTPHPSLGSSTRLVITGD